MNPDEKRFGVFSSSIDPQQLSTAVQASVRIIAGLLVFTGVFTLEQSNDFLIHSDVLVQGFILLVPLVYSMWHSAEFIFGLLRKALVFVSKKKTAPVSAVQEVPES